MARDAYDAVAEGRRQGADHDRGRARRALLLRRGVPPAVPAQGPERLLRAGRDRRLLPHPGRRVLDRGVGPPARRIASRARGTLLRLLHRRLPRRDRHRRGARPRRLLAAALDRARILRRAGAARRRDDRGRACWSSRWRSSARSAVCGWAGSSSSASPSASARRRSAGTRRRATGQEVPAPKVGTVALLIALGVASFTVAEWTFPSQLSLDLGMFGGDTTWYHMPFAATDRAGTLDRPPALHRPAAAGGLVLPAELRADPRRRDRPLQERLALAADQPLLAGDRAAGRLVRRPPLQGRPGDAGRRRDRARRGGDDRDAARGGAQRHHGPGLPDRLRRLPDQRPPAAGAAAAGAVQDAPESDAPLLDKGPLVMAGIAAGLAASVKYTFLIPVVAITIGVVLFSGRGRRWTTAWVMAAADARGRRLLVPAGGDQDRRQPDPDHQVRAAATADAGPDAARPAAALRRRPLPDRPDDLPPLVLPPARQRLRAALAADPDRRRRRRGLHRRALAQPDPAGDRRRRARHRLRLPLHAADRGRPGGLADGLLHQHPLPGAGAGAGDGAAADRAAAAGARQARLADAALLSRGLRDHGADDAALVPGLHRRHDLHHPGAGLGAGGAGPGAGARPGQPRPSSPRSAPWCCCSRSVLGRAQQVQYADHHYTKSTLFLGEGGPQEAYDFARRQHEQADRHRRLQRDHLRPVRLLRRRPQQPRPVHRRARARTGPTAWRPPAGSSAAGSTPATTTT